MDPAVQQQMLKLMSVRLCPPLPGQVVLDMVVSPPEPSDPSFAQFQAVSAAERPPWGAAGQRAGAGLWGAAPTPDGRPFCRRNRRCWPSWRPRPG